MIIPAFQTPNCRYAVISWEPVAGSNERLNVAAIAEFNGHVITKILIRSEVLRCMYGTAGDSIANMISILVDAIGRIGTSQGMSTALLSIPLANFTFSKEKNTYATNEYDLFRQIILMNFSLSVIADDGSTDSEEPPISEKEINQQWTSKIKLALQITRPDLSIYFNREAILVENGMPVKFGILAPGVAIHFGLIKLTSQTQSIKDAKSKMWELSLAKERLGGSIRVSLIFGTPPHDDLTASDRQKSKLESNITELTQEAKYRHVNFMAVQTINDAVNSVIATMT